MRKIKLLKQYSEYSPGDIIRVSNNVAFGLIDNGTARECVNRDFLVKPEFGVSKAMDTKKLSKSPVRRFRYKK